MDTDQIESKYKELYPEVKKIFGPYLRKSDGRKQFTIQMIDGKITSKQYAKLLYEVYYSIRLGKDDTVDHIDNDKTNDDISNLQILSLEENARKSAKGNSYSLGMKHNAESIRSGDKNGKALLTNEEVTKIRIDYHNGDISRKQIEQRYNIADRTLRNLLNGISYKDAGGPLGSRRDR